MIAIISFTLLELYTINEQAFLRTFLDIAWQPSPSFFLSKLVLMFLARSAYVARAIFMCHPPIRT